MSFSPVPDFSFRDVTGIKPDFLSQLGIRFLMLDMDNTIAAYGTRSPTEEVLQWVAEIKKSGVKLYLVSNSIRKGRAEEFAGILDIGFIKGARKPSPKGVRKAMSETGFDAHESSLVGDQAYTDVLAANRAGVVSIAVRPIRFSNPALALRYALELPFRALCKNKRNGKKHEQH